MEQELFPALFEQQPKTAGRDGAMVARERHEAEVMCLASTARLAAEDTRSPRIVIHDEEHALCMTYYSAELRPKIVLIWPPTRIE